MVVAAAAVVVDGSCKDSNSTDQSGPAETTPSFKGKVLTPAFSSELQQLSPGTDRGNSNTTLTQSLTETSVSVLNDLIRQYAPYFIQNFSHLFSD